MILIPFFDVFGVVGDNLLLVLFLLFSLLLLFAYWSTPFQLLGYYWHLQHHLGKALREGLDKVIVFVSLSFRFLSVDTSNI